MGLNLEDDKRPSKLAIMDEDSSDKPSEFFFFSFSTAYYLF